MAKPFSRKGLHKLECPMCDGFLYATVAMLEAKGLPMCWPPCGETLQPTELELAILLEAWQAPVYVEYVDLAARKEMAQKPKQIRASRAGQPERELNNMWTKAAGEIEVLRQQRAKARSGRGPKRLAIVEDMPF